MDRIYIDFIEEHSPASERILESSYYKKLMDYPRHGTTNTFDHCVRVAVCMIWLSSKLNLNVDSAVKTGLLHDLCFVDYLGKHDHPGIYCFYHPEEAADNAIREFGLTRTEERAIRSHMFPLSVHVPSSRLALTLTLADKMTALYEVLFVSKAVHQALGRMAAKRTVFAM